MKNIGKNIKKLREARKITQKDLARLLDVSSYTTIGKWESGSNFPQGRELIKLSKLFNVSVDEILDLKPLPKITNDLSEYKYLPTTISAGVPLNIESISEDEIEKIEIPDKLMGSYAGKEDVYITKISGDSMNKIIPDGSFIALRKVTSVNELQDGDIVLFSDEHEYSVKRFYRTNDTLAFRPDSNNPSYFDHITSTNNSNLVIYGKVVWYIVEI